MLKTLVHPFAEHTYTKKYFRALTEDNLTLRLRDQAIQHEEENKAKSYNKHLLRRSR